MSILCNPTSIALRLAVKKLCTAQLLVNQALRTQAVTTKQLEKQPEGIGPDYIFFRELAAKRLNVVTADEQNKTHSVKDAEDFAQKNKKAKEEGFERATLISSNAELSFGMHLHTDHLRKHVFEFMYAAKYHTQTNPPKYLPSMHDLYTMLIPAYSRQKKPDPAKMGARTQAMCLIALAQSYFDFFHPLVRRTRGFTQPRRFLKLDKLIKTQNNETLLRRGQLIVCKQSWAHSLAQEPTFLGPIFVYYPYYRHNGEKLMYYDCINVEYEDTQNKHIIKKIPKDRHNSAHIDELNGKKMYLLIRSFQVGLLGQPKLGTTARHKQSERVIHPGDLGFDTRNRAEWLSQDLSNALLFSKI